MAFNSKFGITMIKPFTKYGHDCLEISYEADNGVSQDKGPDFDLSKCKAVFLYTPTKGDFEHSHIMLTRGQCRKLRDWLDGFLKEDETPAKTQSLFWNKCAPWSAIKDKIEVKSQAPYVS